MDLNDDCWNLIFSLLCLKDQISVALSCQRFYTLLTSIWQTKYLNLSLRRVFFDTDEQFNVLLKSICNTVEIMDLGCLTFNQWNVIKLYSYPNSKTLCMAQPQPSSDECILEMTKIFPNLHSFYLSDSPDISGNHIEKWENLTDLSFYNCENVKFIHFENILKKRRLKSLDLGIFYEEDGNWTWQSDEAFKNFYNLEKIALCSDELKWLSNLSLFSNLKALELFDLANDELVFELVRNIAKYKYNDLLELHISIHFPLKILLVKQYENLRKISFLWRNNFSCMEVLKYAPNLREIVFKECKDLKEEEIYILLKSDQLEFISIEKCITEFPIFKLNVKDIVEHRSNLLHFNFYKNSFGSEKVTLNIQGQSSLLKVTCDKLNSDWDFSNWFKFL